jgi:hypothetical protein
MPVERWMHLLAYWNILIFLLDSELLGNCNQPSGNRGFCLSICLSVCLSVRPSVHVSVYVSVCPSVQPSIHPSNLWLYSPCGSKPLVQFLNLYTVGGTPWTWRQPVARPLPAHRTTQSQNKPTQTFMPRVRFEPTVPVFERTKTVHALDRAATVIVISLLTYGNITSACVFA